VQLVPRMRVFAVLRNPGRKRVSTRTSKATPVHAPPPATTEDLINRLSHERLMLYHQGSGHPLPKEVRARLGEIVRELDRLWEQRRYELATGSPYFEAAASPKGRSRNHSEVA
jgi:hypothetical protein